MPPSTRGGVGPIPESFSAHQYGSMLSIRDFLNPDSLRENDPVPLSVYQIFIVNICTIIQLMHVSP